MTDEHPFDQSNDEVERAMGMTLEQARDVCALNYLNVYLRIVARELGVPVPSKEALVEGVSDLTVVLNCGTQIAFCSYVQDKRMATEALNKLRAIVDEIPG